MKTCCSSNTSDKECVVNQMEKYLSCLDGLVKKDVKRNQRFHNAFIVCSL